MKKIIKIVIAVVLGISLATGFGAGFGRQSTKVQAREIGNITLGTQYTGTAPSESNPDIYNFSFEVTGKLTIHFQAKNHIYINCRITDSDGKGIAGWRTERQNLETTGVVYLKKGNYNLVMATDYMGSNVSYIFSTEFTPIKDTNPELQTSNNDTKYSASDISNFLGKSICSVLTNDETTDIFKFTMPSNGSFQIQFSKCIEDLDLYLEDSYGEISYENGDIVQGNVYEFYLAKGTYYLTLYSKGNHGENNFKPSTSALTTTKLSSVKNTKKGNLTVSWKRKATADGYCVQVAT
ncbi:MAG: hypothetical protein IJ733_01935, partial [Lachnospiraceae bacterium]|nr:hypothetical protein [Lachnospiraceae bacterium]